MDLFCLAVQRTLLRLLCCVEVSNSENGIEVCSVLEVIVTSVSVENARDKVDSPTFSASLVMSCASTTAD